jgi:phospho-N-acetylmuramoyl-pentapeptide-transferase
MVKSGTPTMGGIVFIISVAISLMLYLLFSKPDQTTVASILIAVAFAVANSMVGIMDDLTKLKRKVNGGLKPYEKLILQLLIAIVFLMARKHFLGDETYLNFSFGNIELGWLYYPLAILIILGTTNCANLTDGIDGLASSVALTIGFAFVILGANRNASIAPISAAIIGTALGFLFYNRHPAKIFMGDTGSLFFGAMFASCCIALGNPLIILFSGIIYLIEGASVIIQVIFYKLTKRRVFKMAPFHHHLEKCGWSENKIVIFSIILTLATSFFAGIIFV